MECKFKIAMDAEQKKLGNIKEVILDVDFEGVDAGIIQKHAIANMVVQWQNQIRSHWDEFVDGKMPTEIKFGDPLFATGRRTSVRTMTPDEMIAYIKSLPQDEQADWIDKLVQ